MKKINLKQIKTNIDQYTEGYNEATVMHLATILNTFSKPEAKTILKLVIERLELEKID